MRGTLGRLLAALSAGLGAWCSLGVLAVAHTGGRVGVLPPLWLLAVTILVSSAAVFGLRWSAARSLPLFAALACVLPWVPGTTVGAFLLFTGPITWLWWTLIAVACAVSGPLSLPAAVTGLLRDPRRAPWVAGLIVATVSGAAAVHFQDWLPGADEPHYLVITQSLMRDGDLQIQNNHVRGDYLAYYPSELAPDFLKRGVNRQIYSIHAPGLSAIVIPAFAVGGYPGVVVFLILCGAFGSVLSWWLGYQATGAAGAAWAGWAVVATSITFIVHTFMVFPDGLSGVCVLVGIWALFTRADVPAWRFGVLGAAVALLPWLHTRNAPAALVIGLAVAWTLLQQRAWRPLVAWLAPLSLGALSWLAFFKVIYGVFDPSAPYGGFKQSSLENIPHGLAGLLFDQQFGLLAYAPALAVALVGIAVMAMPQANSPAPIERHRPAVGSRTFALILVAIAVPYAGLASSYGMWWGGASAPARFLAPIVLPLAIPAAVAWQRCASRASRGVFVGLVVTSAVVLVALLTVQRGILTFNGRDGFAALAEWASPVGDLSQALPSVHRDPFGVVVGRSIAWGAVPLVCWAMGWLLTRRPGRSRGGVALGMLATAVAASSVAADASWSMRGTRRIRADASQVRLVEALADVNAGALPVVFRDAPRNDGFGRTERVTKIVTRDDLVSRLSFSTSLRRPPRDTAFGAGLLPAGTYRLHVATGNAAAGGLDVAIGRDGAALRHLDWNQPEGAATATVDFDLAVPVRLVTVRGDPAALQAVTEVAMRPLQVRRRDERLGQEDVARLASNGAFIVYLLSDAQYVERDGLWIRPSTDVPMIVARDGAVASGPLRIFVRNGPFENQVTLTGTASQSLTLAPNEERLVPLDITWIDGAGRLVIRASRGFRPFEVDATATDRRLLGVWMAFP